MINIIATLRLNIKAFGLKKGLRLPAYVYGRLKMKSVGTINLKCPVRRRMFIIGVNHDTCTAPFTLLNNTGTIDIYGKTYINYGCMLENKGHIVFRGNNIFGNKTEIIIHNGLDMGYNTSCGYNSHVTDTNAHYMVDVATRRVYRESAPIRLGRFNFLGSHTYVKKGTVTPDYMVAASPNTLLTKDYSDLPPYTILAGNPARPLKQGIRRIHNYATERRLRTFFKEHPDADCFQVGADADLDELCAL